MLLGGEVALQVLCLLPVHKDQTLDPQCQHLCQMWQSAAIVSPQRKQRQGDPWNSWSSQSASVTSHVQYETPLPKTNGQQYRKTSDIGVLPGVQPITVPLPMSIV